MKKLYITVIFMLCPSSSILSMYIHAQEAYRQEQPITTTQALPVAALIIPISRVVIAQPIRLNQIAPLPVQRQRVNLQTHPETAISCCCIMPYIRRNTTPEIIVSGDITRIIDRDETEYGFCCCHFATHNNRENITLG